MEEAGGEGASRGGDGGLAVISPHYDDAVFSCADLLADCPGSDVITVLGARPAPPPARVTPWDAAAGFAEGDDVVERRREEDAAALRLLCARGLWLPFLDSQYGSSPPSGAVADALEAALGRLEARRVLFPLGLFHSDHLLTHEAAYLVARRRPDLEWWLYADALYRALPGFLAARLAALEAEGRRLVPLPPSPRPASGVKRHAVACYASQIRALATPGRPSIEDAFAPEAYWRLER